METGLKLRVPQAKEFWRNTHKNPSFLLPKIF